MNPTLFESDPATLARSRAVDQLHEATAIYTREPVVDSMLDMVGWPRLECRIADTSCGDGVFLGAALGRLLNRFPNCHYSTLAYQLQGWEVHPFAASQARTRIERMLIEAGAPSHRAKREAQRMIRCADFLTDGPVDEAFDLIVGNPPYLRFLNVPEPLRGEYEGVVPAHARADLLHSFIDRSAGVLADGGQLALVTADRWLFNDGAAQLRQIVGERFGIASLRRLDPASAFYRPKHRRAGSPPRIHPVVVVMRTGGGGLQPLGRDPIFPGDDGSCARYTTGAKLSDVADIRLAPWLGTPGIFLIDAAAARKMPRSALVPAVDTDDIVQGQLRKPTRFAILTAPGVKPAPSVLEHLARQLPRMAARGRQRKESWIPPETFHRLDLSQPSLLVPRIAKTLKPVRVPAGVLPVNHNLSIVRSGSMSLDDIEAALSSPSSAEWVQRFAAPLEGGYLSITTRLLRQLPIP